MKDVAIFGQQPNTIGFVNVEEAARNACAGRLGEQLASMLGVTPERFYARHWCFNLNATPTQPFDKIEAARTALLIYGDHPDIRRVVCLGRDVGEVMGFGTHDPWLYSKQLRRRSYLLFPHPSGRNRWWNDDMNRCAAGEALRKFLK